MAISFAEKVNKGEISVKKVEDLNQDIEKFVKDNRTKTEKKDVSKANNLSVRKDLIRNLKKFLKGNSSKLEGSAQVCDEVIELIASFEEGQSGISQNLESIVEVLSKFPSIPKRACRYLFKLLIENEQKLGKVANVIEDYQTLWKKTRIQEKLDTEMTQIKNPKLRKHVCRRFSIELQKFGISKRESQVKALNIEESIRIANEDMGEDYIKKCKLALKHLKDKLD